MKTRPLDKILNNTFDNTIICIVGLPASGKTTLAYHIKKYSPEYSIFDDVKNINDKEKLELSILSNKNSIIIDSTFCIKESRQQFENYIFYLNKNKKIKWIFFQNNPYQCKVNLKKRKDGRNINDSSIDLFSKDYTIDSNCTIVPVYNKNLELKVHSKQQKYFFKNFGFFAEKIAEYKLKCNGYNVLVMPKGWPHYDLLAFKDGKWNKVQVKSTLKNKVKIKLTTSNSKNKYIFDILIVIRKDLRTFLFENLTRKSIYVGPNNKFSWANDIEINIEQFINDNQELRN